MAVVIKGPRQSKRFSSMKIFGSKSLKKRHSEVLLNVTALVDMMSVLVIFLVMQFSASGEMVFVFDELVLPAIKNADGVKYLPVVSLNRLQSLYFEGEIIETKLTPPNSADDWMVMPLYDRLKKFSTNKDEQENRRAINLQIDKSVDFALIKRVIHTLEVAGFSQIRFSVLDTV